MNAEGWYVDPYGLHDARWFSDGHPTALVRDHRVESRDAPPSIPYTGQLERIAELSLGPDSSSRAGDEGDTDTAWSIFDESTGAD